MHWGLSSLITIWKRKRRIYYWNPWAISRRGRELELAGEKEIKQLSERILFDIHFMSKYHGKQDVFLVEETFQDHHRERIIVSFGSASYFIFPESLSLKVPKTTVWPSALWKSICKGCGFLFSTWQSAALENDRARYTARRSRAFKSSVPPPSPLLPVVCVQFCQLFVFSNLGKNCLFVAGQPEGWPDNYHSFRWRCWERVMLLTHKTLLPGWVARTGIGLLRM